MERWAFTVLCAVLVSMAMFTGCSSSNRQAEITTAQAATATEQHGPATSTGTNVGDIAPDFQLTQVDGATVSPGDLRGQPAVLVFWTAWCPTCKEEAPRFNELAARYEPRGVRVLGIDIQDSPARTAAGIKEFGIRYAVARDADASVARRYNVTGTPTVVFLDGRGGVRYFANELPADYAARLDTLAAERN